MKARVVTHGTDYFHGPKGTVMFVHNKAEKIVGLTFKCPECGEPAFYPFVRNPYNPPATWDGDRLNPSIKERLHEPMCGWRGYLTNGEFHSPPGL